MISELPVRPRVPPNGYDPAGNVLNDLTNQYAYDGEGRICAVYNPYTGYTQYIYDGEGRRVAKGTINFLSCNTGSNGFAPAESYLLGQAGEHISELDGSGNFLRSHVYANGQLLATYANGTTEFPLGDWLGTNRVVANPDGTIAGTCINLPFGDELICNGNVPVNGHHFTGQVHDLETGNEYFGARYYGSWVGRFMSPDPSGLAFANPANPQSLNLYSYALNNPLINIDPTGMECVWDDGSYDSADDPQTGNAQGCSGQGGTYVNPDLFENAQLTNGQNANIQYGSWSGQANSTIASSWLTPSSTTNAGPWDFATFSAYGSLWAAGALPTQLNYGPNDPATLAMINRPYVQTQLAAYAQAGCPASFPAGQESGAAYKESAGDVASGNPNYVQMEVGGYSGHVTTSGGVTNVTLSNVSGISSLSGYSAGVGAINTATGSHLNRNALDTTSGPGRNVTQTFNWSEPSPCGH